MRFLPLSLLACLLVPAALHAQKSDPYAAEGDVIERYDEVISMEADGTGYRERTIVVRVQSEAALRNLGVLTIAFAGASERVEMHYARVRRPDGTVIETPVTDAQEQPTAVTREAPFYSDQKEKQLPIRSLRVGDRLEWQVRVVRTKAEAPNQFWGNESFDESDILLAETVELRVPKASTVNVWSKPGVTRAVETDSATQHIYHWDYSYLKPTVGAEADAAKKLKAKTALTPEEVLDAEQGKLPSIQWSTFKSWAEVGAWYRGLEGDRMKPDADVTAKVAELTKGMTDPEEKAKAVYNFVASQLRYIGVAFGIGRFQPHAASDVLANQYGDCKDKHTLLAAMLTAIGLHPDAVLIGQGVRFNQAVPSPEAFNHLITRVEITGKPVWLDSTTEVAPYRALVYPIRDREALVIPDTAPAHLDRTPKDLPYPSFETMKAVGSIDKNGVADSKLVVTLRDDSEIILRAVTRQIGPAQYDALVQRISASMGYGGTTSHAELGNLQDTSKPLIISYDYHRDRTSNWDSFQIVPQLLPVGLPVPDEKEPALNAIQLGVPTSNTSNAEMKIPAGWGAELPEAVHEKTDFATYDQTYRFEKGVIYTERRVTVLKGKLPASDWKIYKRWTDKIDLGSDMFIRLTRSAIDTATVLAGPPSEARAEAAKLIQQAFETMKTDRDAARDQLKQAEHLNDNQPDLWGAYGALEYTSGNMKRAIDNYRKELALHPSSHWVYAPLVRALTFTDHRPEALAALRSWVAAEPSDADAVMFLVRTLTDDADPKGALAAATAGVAALPADKQSLPAVQLMLGRAQLKGGQVEAGTRTMTALLADGEDPLTLNGAAYALAEAKQSLPEAEKAQRKALDRLADETRSWTLDEAPDVLKAKTSLLIAAWDTMGWIFFREGKLEEALSYVEAAWNGHPDSEVSTHLGDIRTAKGDRAGATAAYKVAADAKSSESAMRHSVMTRAGKGQTMSALPASSSMINRVVPLGPAGSRTGNAEYKILFSRTEILRAEPTGTATVHDGVAMLKTLKAARYFPAASDAHLARRGYLNCHSGTCEFIFEE